jgi:4-amino-4-deoxy-L-arabinose transferase-like glycosyltransferase
MNPTGLQEKEARNFLGGKALSPAPEWLSALETIVALAARPSINSAVSQTAQLIETLEQREGRSPRNWRRWRNSLFLMVVAAFALRLLVVAFVYPEVLNPRRDHWPFGNETGRIARSIATGQGFSNPLFERTGPTAWMTPVYPYLLAGVFKVFGVFTPASAWVILSLNSLFSALTGLPIFFMARRHFGPAVATWAGWAWAFFPYAVYLSASFVWENTLACLLLSILFVLTLELEGPARLATWVGYGLLWGLAALVSPVVLSLFPFLAGWAFYRLHQQKQNWFAPAAVAALALVAALAPWEVRNYRTFHRLLPLRDNFWLEVWVGNNGDTSNWWVDAAHPSNSEQELTEYDRLGELAYMAQKRRQAVTFISRHPGVFLQTTFRRFIYTWTGYWSFQPSYLAEERFDPANIAFSVPLTILMLVGLRRAFSHAQEVALPYALTLLIYPVVYYVTHPEMRYRHSIDPQIVILAVYAVVGHFQRKGHPRPIGHQIER